MGIYDREYYRDETGGSGWFSGAAPATRTIILLNVALYLLQVVTGTGGLGPGPLEQWLSASADAILRHGEVWRLLTASFLHDPSNLFHLAWNMLFLWFVGREMEAMYGTLEFSLFYVTAAVVSTFCWALSALMGPDDVRTMMLGASGAVMAVVLLYTLYYPRREVILFVLAVPMWLLLTLYIGRDLIAFLQSLQAGIRGRGTQVAVVAHLAGAAYGYLYKAGDLRWTRLLSRRPRKPRLRVVSAEPRDRVPPVAAARPAGLARAASTVPEEQLDARLDEVLAKIAREGRSSLTDDDHRVLQEASRRARDRRSHPH